jgi:hypothetical protein
VPDLTFRKLPRCQYGVYDPGRGEDGYESNCGEPAAYEVTFGDGISLPLYVCDLHARALEEAEGA